jgi:hypothetical protein
VKELGSMATRKKDEQPDEQQPVGTPDQEPRQQPDDGSAVQEPSVPAGSGDQLDVDEQADADTASVQEAVDVETDQGYRGSVPDETPNRNYTVAGQTEGAPTPEAGQQ